MTSSRPRRLDPVDLVVLLLLVGSVVVAATIQHPRTDVVQLGPLHHLRLRLFQELAGGGLLLFGVQLVRRPTWSLCVRMLLPLALGTLLVLIVVSMRVSVLGRGGP